MQGGRTCLRDFVPLNVRGKSYGRLWLHTDITERKRREERIAKLTRLYAVLSRVNETIVRARDAETLFSEVCRIVAEIGEFPLVWIGEVRGRQVVPVACAGPATDYLEGIQIEIDGPLGLGPGGTAFARIARSSTTIFPSIRGPPPGAGGPALRLPRLGRISAPPRRQAGRRADALCAGSRRVRCGAGRPP